MKLKTILLSLPVTATQKALKHKIFSADIDPRKQEGVFDLRRFKKRTIN